MSIFTAFDDVRVLDLTVNLAGPFATQILSDLGAEIIKVERPGRGDDSRSWMPRFANDDGVVFAAVNCNKRSIVLDLRSPEDIEKALKLGESCDVVVESFRPGKADEMGLGYEAFKARNDAIVYCSVSAFGRGEAGSTLPGYDPLIQAFSGIMSMTGHPGNPPTRVAASLIDLSTGMWAALGISTALAERHRTGAGQYLEATLVDTGYMLMCHQISGYFATGEVPGQYGSGSPINAPYEAFKTADGWVMIAAGNDRLFERLCDVLGVSELATDERFSSTRGRTSKEYRELLHELLEARTVTQTSDHWMEAVHAAGVPIGPVQRVDEAATHAIVAERELLVVPDGSEDPNMRLVRLPLTANGQNPPLFRAPPKLGEHTDEILAELGGLGLLA
jgi:crotonobetainyl-CoA:carnitine CoA-transferase CaiB-like acyl-CoA transferase